MNPSISGIKCQQKCEIPQQCDIPKQAESLPKNIPVKKTVQSQSLEELQSKKQFGREPNKISRDKSNLVATPHRDRIMKGLEPTVENAHSHLSAAIDGEILNLLR